MPLIRLILFREDTGYGNAAKNLLRQLQQTPGITVDVVEILPGKPKRGGIYLSAATDHQQLADHVIIHTVPEYYPFWYHYQKTLNPTAKVWGYTAWETDSLPRHWPALLNLLDGVFVPCTWNKAVFEACGVCIPVKLLPHISEYEGKYPQSPAVAPIFELNPAHFIFYTIGVWNERKNNSALIQAFLNEFSTAEPVSLVIKTGQTDWINCKRRLKTFFLHSFGKLTDAFAEAIKNHKNPHVYHLSEQLPAAQIALLHQTGDCFISLTRGEGWGMGAYEAAWFGKPVAITRFGGSMDFLDEAQTYWLNYKLVPVQTAYGKKSYSSNQNWAQVDIKSAQRTMRHIFQNQQEAVLKGKQLQKTISRNLAAEDIMKNFIETLNA